MSVWSPHSQDESTGVFGLPDNTGKDPQTAYVKGISKSVVTTDYCGFDSTANTFHLQGLGSLSEMGDAVLGYVTKNMPPPWLAVRNISDPQIKSEGTIKEQASAPAQIYKSLGRWSTVCTAITCAAVIAELSFKVVSHCFPQGVLGTMPTPSNPTATVFSVSLGASLSAANVKQLGNAKLAAGYSVVESLTAGSNSYLIAYDPSSITADVYEVTATAPYLSISKTKLAIGKAKDKLNVFTLGNQPYLSVYTAKNGVFQIYSVDSSLSLSKPYEFYRNHELALSQNFSTLKFFVQFGQVAALGYRDDGYVATYTASIVNTSPAGYPPLLMTPVWSHMWAPGWTRFAFFLLGGEPFFLKTNTKKLNVNIDHVLDMLPSGTAEVGTLLQNQLPDALKITNVEALLLGNADPWFVTYISPSGAATLNRIHADCLGWTQGASFKAPTGSATVAPITADGQTLLVFI